MKILVACDGSAASTQAVQYLNSAPFQEASVTFVHVVPVIECDLEALPKKAQEKVTAFNSQLQQEGTKVLDQAQKLLTATRYQSEQKTLEGSAAEQIIQLSSDYDLILMGSRGVNPVESFFLGSESDQVVRYAHCSVLIFRQGMAKSEPGTEDRFKVLLGYDEAHEADATDDMLRHLDGSKVAEICLAAVIQATYLYGPDIAVPTMDFWPQYKKELEAKLLATKAEIAARHPQCEVATDVILDSSDIATELNRVAVEEDADLIVVRSKGKNLLERVVLGSVSSKLVHHAQLPVLIVR